ncbi:MAG TPA: hypothetical protein HPP83_10275 [Candidatus Hydrogenedentes bacterium]|nr:hypothetical protein [Candidatus Hydrogenedentota bacterium]
MSLEGILESEAGLTILGTVLGGIWTFFKSTSWYARQRRRRYYRAIEALEAGVEQTYRTYVRAIKEASADGRLSDEERRHARQLAREAAIAFGRTEGVDVLRELGEAYIDLWIAKLVQRLKQR